MQIVLGSGSKYRAELLRRIITNFQQDSPDIDETALPDEAPEALARRLAVQKAEAIAGRWPDSLIISSDQVAVLNYAPDSFTDQPQLSKPGNFDNAMQQLLRCSGQTVTYITACCLLNTKSMRNQLFTEHYRLHFRSLNEQQIAAYLNAEQPYDCAGAIKSEGLGVALVHRYDGDDPSALIGLPLVRLTEALASEGYAVLDNV